MFKGTMTNWPVQKLSQGTTQKLNNIMTQQTFRQTFFLYFSVFFAFLHSFKLHAFVLSISILFTPKYIFYNKITWILFL